MSIEKYEKNMFNIMETLNSDTRKIHGITFTPLLTVNFMFKLIDLDKIDGSNFKILEPSCGTGIFVLYYLEHILTNNKLNDIKLLTLFENIYAFDIQNTFIDNLKEDLLQLINSHITISNDTKNKLIIIMNKNIKAQSFLDFDMDIKFDLIIGNPPYVRRHNLDENTKNSLLKPEYKDFYNGLSDLSLYFTYKATKLLNKNGEILFITSSKFITSKYGFNLRQEVYQGLNYYSDKYDTPFKDVQIDTCIIKISNNIEPILSINGTDTDKKLFPFFEGQEWIFNKPSIVKKGKTLKELGISISNGVVSGYNKAHILTNTEYTNLINLDSSLTAVIKPIINGKDILLDTNTYETNKFIIYATKNNDNFISNNKTLMEHFEIHRTKLENRSWYKNNNKLPFFRLQGNTQFSLGEFNFLTKRIGTLQFIKAPKSLIYMDTVYNLIYPKNIDIDKLIELLKQDNIQEVFHSISNKIGKKIEIHKNKFERIILNPEEESKITK